MSGLKLSADFSRATGPVKALHGVNNSPVTFGEPIETFREAGIPYVRLHDTMGGFGGAHFVDIPNVFPDFNADPLEPSSYDFAFTDAYLKGLTSSGCKIFYRLGVTIENYCKVKAYHIHPPKDYQKWAVICEHVIRHYNEGWADGFRYGIEYWEIWNEPENPQMWTGTMEEFFALYRLTARYLKSCFPSLKIGGYASCGFYVLTRSNAPAWYHSFVKWFEAFLKELSSPETAAPLDFYSWHLYTYEPEEIAKHAAYVRRMLDEHGFTATESIFNEWHCTPVPVVYDHCRFVDIKEEPGASGTAAAFAHLQYSPVDKAMYYDAYPARTYCGLYNYPAIQTTRTYDAFYAFNVLYRLGTACAVEFANDRVVLTAARNASHAAVLAANYTPEAQTVELELKQFAFTAPEVHLTDKTHRFDVVTDVFDGRYLSMPPYSVILVTSAPLENLSVSDGEMQHVNIGGLMQR